MSSKAGMYCEDSSVAVSNCVFADNNGYAGAGVFNTRYSESAESYLVFSNCVFSENIASSVGGGIFFAPPEPVSARLTNCTFYGNEANTGGGMVNVLCNMPVTNCVFWGNTADVDSQIYTYYECDGWKPSFSHCDIEDSYTDGDYVKDYYTYEILGINAGGNIAADPDFDIDDPEWPEEDGPDGADNTWATTDDGLIPGHSSPCANAADLYATPLTDITGRLWPPDKHPDIGAYKCHSNIVVMCWINESSPYADRDVYDKDLAKYRSLIANLDVVKSVCLVPSTTIEYVLPVGCPPPIEISVETCGVQPTEAELITDFDNIRDGAIPDCVILLADESSSLGGFDGNPGLGQGYVDFRDDWLKPWLEDHGLDPEDDKILREKEFGDLLYDGDFHERWIAAITREIEDVLGQ